MIRKELIKILIDENYSKPPKKNYPTNKIVYNHINEIWSIDLDDMIEYKNSNNKEFRYIFIIIGFFSKYLWCIPLKNEYSETITNGISNIPTTSKRSLLKIQGDRRAEFYNSIFQKLLKSKNLQHFSRYTDKGPSIAERIIRTIRNLLKKPKFFVGKASWIDELISVTKKNNTTIHHSIKMTPVQASRKSNEKLVYSNLKDNRESQKPNFKLGQLVRTTDIKRVFSKSDSANFSYKLYAITGVIDDTIPSNRNNYLLRKT